MTDSTKIYSRQVYGQKENKIAYKKKKNEK